jgi:hypothetical protein
MNPPQKQFSLTRVASRKQFPIHISWLLALLLALPAAINAQFVYTTNNGALTLTEYNGPGGDVVIPNSIDGYPVVHVGHDLFNEIALTSVVIPDGITSIGDSAFEYSSLPAVVIPSTVTNIENSAFHGCPLSSVVIPPSVVQIGTRAFYGGLISNVVIPASVLQIGVAPFAQCKGLSAITVNPSNTAFCSVDGVLFDKNQTALLEYPVGKVGDYSVPAGVMAISEAAFGGASISNIILPDSLTSIGASAFSGCVGLTNIVIPANVTNIGSYAWTYSGLQTVTIPDGVTRIEDFCFYYATKLTKVILPAGVTRLGNQAFFRCTSLAGLYCRGDAPTVEGGYVFTQVPGTVYYLPGTSGWGSLVGGRPTAPWWLPAPVIIGFGSSFGIRTNQFGFVVSWATNGSVAIDACTNLASPAWIPLQTNSLVNGSSYFSDPDWTNHPVRHYRIRSP